MNFAAVPGAAFTAAACLLAAAGVALGAWALLWDRPRGRRRCPKCWYSMDGVPGLMCPECGRSARSERALFRTRRQRLPVLVSLLLFCSAYGSAQAPVVRSRGWQAAVPTTALILLLPWLESPRFSDPVLATMVGLPQKPSMARLLFHELEQNRLRVGELWGWQARILIARCLRGDSRRPVGLAAWARSYGQLLLSVPLVHFDEDDLDRWGEAAMSSVVDTRARWPKGVPIQVRLEPSYHMVRGDDRILEVVPAFSGADPTYLIVGAASGDFGCGRLGWPVVSMDGTTGVGTPGSEIESTPFKVRLRAMDGEVVWSAQTPVEIAVRGQIHDVIRPVRSRSLNALVQNGLRLEKRLDGMQVVLAHVPATTAPTIALRLDLLVDGIIRDTLFAWSPAHREQLGRFLHLPHAGSTMSQWSVPFPEDPDRYTVRVRGDAHLALRDFESTEYWDGEFTVPLTDLLHESTLWSAGE